MSRKRSGEVCLDGVKKQLMKYNVTLEATVEAENAEAAKQMVFDKAAGDVDVTAGGTEMNHSLYEVKDNGCGHDYVVCEGVVRIIGDGEINCPVCETPTNCNGQLVIMRAKEPSGGTGSDISVLIAPQDSRSGISVLSSFQRKRFRKRFRVRGNSSLT
jgi:hypothetical protein